MSKKQRGNSLPGSFSKGVRYFGFLRKSFILATILVRLSIVFCRAIWDKKGAKAWN